MVRASVEEGLRVLAACCAAGFDSSRLVPPCDRLSRGFDPEWLTDLAARHRVEALVCDALHRAGVDVPARLRARAAAIQQENFLLAAEIARIDDHARTRNIDILFIKGLATATLAYSKPMAKSGWDIDMLVAPTQVAGASALLRDLSYRPILPTQAIERWHRRRKESVWINDAGQTVELHSRLSDNRGLIPSIGMESERQAVTILSRTVETLGDDALIAYACVHGASSLWFRLKWLSDLAALLFARHGGSDVDPSFRVAERLGAGRAAGQAFLLAHRWFDTPLSITLRDELERDRKVRILTDLAERAMKSGEPTDSVLGTVPIRSSQLLLKPGAGFALGEGFRQMGDVLQDRLHR